MELENEIKLLEIEGTQDALKRAETLKNDLIVLEKDYELQKNMEQQVKILIQVLLQKHQMLLRVLMMRN